MVAPTGGIKGPVAVIGASVLDADVTVPAFSASELLENGAGTRGRRDNERILVVVQWQEAYIERKIGGNKEAPNVST